MHGLQAIVGGEADTPAAKLVAPGLAVFILLVGSLPQDLQHGIV